MPLVGLGTAFLGFVFAELQGNDSTRPATRYAFLAVVLTEWGATLSGALDVVANAIGAIPL